MEKTFEELIDDKFGLQFDKSEKEEIKELLQQVREATIAECSQIIEDIVGNTFDEIEEIKTDRIKIVE